MSNSKGGLAPRFPAPWSPMSGRPACMVAGCSRTAIRKGLCETHHLKFTPVVAKAPRAVRLCEAPGCGAKHYGKGFCRGHYDERFKPKAAPKPPPKPAIHMVCPDCGAPELGVVDSRPSSENTIRRRRRCGGCGSRFTTFEVFAEARRPKLNFRPAVKALEAALAALGALAEPEPATEAPNPQLDAVQGRGA